MANLTLKPWFHPSMRVPFPLDISKHTIQVTENTTIMSLMERVEALVEGLGKQAGADVQMQIQVLWNLKNAQKALNPSENVGKCFVDGDTFGCYGDIATSPVREPPIPECDKLPVTILTGFLGSGKTTLLNYILQEQHEKKIAVIENEFGEVSIDDELLKGNKLALAEKVVVMDNGCMCCTVRGDLQQGLEQILAEVDKGNKIDQVMIETTGMADPVPIVRTFMTSEHLTRRLRLDGVVTVADAKHIIGRLDDKVEEGKVNEAYQQVAFCDRMLLNKLDLVTPDAAIVVKDRLRSINPYAKILPAVRSRVKMEEITNLRAHDMSNFISADIEKEAEVVEHGHGGHGGEGHGGGHDGHGGHGDAHGHDEKTCSEDHGHGGNSGHGDAHGHGHADAHGHTVKKSRHDSRVNSMALVREGEIFPHKLGPWMQSLGTLPEDKGLIFRIKGILAIKNHPYKHVFHAVMDVSDEDDAEAWAPGEKRVTKIVFIGKSLDKEHIRKGFEGCFEP